MAPYAEGYGEDDRVVRIITDEEYEKSFGKRTNEWYYYLNQKALKELRGRLDAGNHVKIYPDLMDILKEAGL